MGDVSKEYDKLAVKHKLPSFKALTEFDVESIESDANILSSVRHKIADRLHDCTDFVSDLLQPDTNLVTMYESEAIPEDEKPEVYNLFRRLMYWRRASFEAHLDSSEQAQVDFINKFMKEWPALKPSVASVAGKVTALWESDSKSPEKMGYFG